MVVKHLYKMSERSHSQAEGRSLGSQCPDIKHWERPVIRWDPAQSHPNFIISEDGFKFHSRTQGENLPFRSVIADLQLSPGKRYSFDLMINSEPGCSGGNQVKVGITSELNADQDYCFSDKKTGWAYYLRDNALRNDSNQTGESYGAGCSIGQTLRVYVDLLTGTLAFSVDDVYYGPAFSDLRVDQPYYFAVAMRNFSQYSELMRKTPVSWELKAPVLFAKKFSETPCILNMLKPWLFKEAMLFV